MNAIQRHNVNVTGRDGGPPMLFAHGFGCDQNMWRLVAPAFESHHKVIRFDYVGHGQSDRSAYDPRKYSTLDGFADDILAICDEIDLQDVIFVGHSVSAAIGILAANREPGRFSRLVLVCPSPCYIDDEGYKGGFSRESINELLDFLDHNYLGWSSAMAPLIMANPERPELSSELTNSFCRTDPDIAKQFAHVTFLSDNRADFARVTVPSLVVQCSHDVIAQPSVGTYVHQQIAGSRFAVLDATGHCPHLSAPDETIAAIRAYLNLSAREVSSGG